MTHVGSHTDGRRAGTRTPQSNRLSSSPFQFATLLCKHSLEFIIVYFSCVSLTVNFEGKDDILFTFVGSEVVKRASQYLLN